MSSSASSSVNRQHADRLCRTRTNVIESNAELVQRRFYVCVDTLDVIDRARNARATCLHRICVVRESDRTRRRRSISGTGFQLAVRRVCVRWTTPQRHVPVRLF
jgi:hypothetical protein